MEADFGGWATRANIKCSDGRTIMPNAFQNMDGVKVPLVFQHGHSDIENVLGYAILEHRDDGVYAHGFFNDTAKGQAAKKQVEHQDLTSLSIYANNLVEKSKQVVHGVIREVSLVLAGANPGAKIDFVNVQHGDGVIEEMEDEAIIKMGYKLEEGMVLLHADGDDTDDEDDEEDDGETIKDVYETLDEKQKNLVDYLVTVALEGAKDEEKTPKAPAAKHSDDTDQNHLAHQEGAGSMSRNVFDQTDTSAKNGNKNELSHEAMKAIFKDAEKCGSLREAAANYVSTLQHGITNIDVLFPDAKAVSDEIQLDKRRTEWVATVLNGTRHTPFSRIKTFVADLTQDEARAKGYVKGNYKEEEWFGVTTRKTGPTTIYKKQKLDRDDLLDITDFNIVAFLKGEMRLMTEEEMARAILIGDGRSAMANDKIKDPLGASTGDGIRSIVNDHELFVTTVTVNVTDADSDYEEVVDAVMDGFEFYKGTGTPTFFTTIPHLNKFLKARDQMGRRYYANKKEVADALGVKDIVTVEPMKEIGDLIGIIVNLDDYNVGTDRGGELTMFEDFDIDYNQQKYLLETRASGALIKPKSALIIKMGTGTLATPSKPTFNSSTGVVTIPTVTGVVYKGADGTTTLTAGAQSALAAGASTTVYAVPASGYFFANNASDEWDFTRPAGA